jgi:hypothetical protein
MLRDHSCSIKSWMMSNPITQQRICYYNIMLTTVKARVLKMPKREIFDRSDSPDFYTIKSSCVGDLVVKILTVRLPLQSATPPH